MKREFTPEEDAALMTGYRAEQKRRTWLNELAQKWQRTPRACELRLHQLLHGGARAPSRRMR